MLGSAVTPPRHSPDPRAARLILLALNNNRALHHGRMVTKESRPLVAPVSASCSPLTGGPSPPPDIQATATVQNPLYQS